jgi:hypothetical protein
MSAKVRAGDTITTAEGLAAAERVTGIVIRTAAGFVCERWPEGAWFAPGNRNKHVVGLAALPATVLYVPGQPAPAERTASVEEAARVLARSASDECFARLDAWAVATEEQRECGDVELGSGDEEDADWWRRRAQALADAGLLATPTRTEWAHRNASGGAAIFRSREEAEADRDRATLPGHSLGVWRRQVGEWEQVQP